MLWILLAARLLHILGGIFWVGSVLTSVFFLEPAAAKVGPRVAASWPRSSFDGT
jgi:uncharacterized membrane protein